MPAVVKLQEVEFKIEFFLKGSLDSIPSPSTSVKIQMQVGKFVLRFLCKKIAGCCQQNGCFQKFVDKAQQCFAFTPQAKFPPMI